MTFDVKVDFDEGIELLDDLVRGVNSPELMRLLGDELLDYEREAFATSGFGQWAPLDPTTVAGKGSGRVLVDTGGLLNSLTSRSAVDVSGDSVDVSTSVVGGVMAQRGARGAPRRNPVPAPTPAHVQKWADHLLDALVRRRLR